MMLFQNAYNAKVEKLKKIPNIAILVTDTTLNAKINEAKGEIPSITKLFTTNALNAQINVVKGKIPNVTNLAAFTVLTAVWT